MCYSYKISLLAYSISQLSGIYLWNRNQPYDRWFGTFMIVYGQMQLLEALIWYDLNNNDGKNNTFLSSWIPFILMIQVTIQGIWVYIYRKDLIGILFMGLGILLAIIALLLRKYRNTSTEIGPNKHLIWSIEDPKTGKKNLLLNNILGIIYHIILFGTVYAILGIDGFLLLPILLYISSYIWSIYNYSKTGELGSFWCFWVAIISITFLLPNNFV